jgi:hypothetical protein
MIKSLNMIDFPLVNRASYQRALDIGLYITLLLIVFNHCSVVGGTVVWWQVLTESSLSLQSVLDVAGLICEVMSLHLSTEV